jgi:hypothetical protein
VIWHTVSWPRITAVAVLALLGLAAPHVSALALSACTAAVVLGVVVADYVLRPGRDAATGNGAEGGAA